MKKIGLWILLLVLVFQLEAQDKRRLSLDDYENYEWTSNPQISPDGEKVLYSRTWINLMDDKRETDLWIVNTDGSMNRFFLNGSNGRWSPDGTKVAFTRTGEPSGTQIFVKYYGVEGNPTQITKLENSPSNMVWSPDGKHIAFTMHVDESSPLSINIPRPPQGAQWTKAPKVVSKVSYRRDRMGFYDDGFRHIFVVSADGGTARQLTSGDWNHGGSLTWAPDGKHIIFSGLREEGSDYAWGQSNLYTVHVGTGEIKELTNRAGAESSAKVSPDGKKVAFVGTIDTDHFFKKRELFLMNMDGTGLKSISSDLDRRPANLMWSDDSKQIYFSVDDQGTRNVYRTDLNGQFEKLTKGTHMLSASSMSSNGMIVGTLSSPQQPSDVVAFSINNPSTLKQLTAVNKDLLDYISLGKVEEIRYQSTDGKEIQGWIVKPPQFDPSKKYPLVLRIHGGPHSMYHVGFNMNFQLHAAQDQVVLYTNPRGSTGYGYDFADAIQNAYPGNDYDDLMSGVDAVIEKGYIDENKLYVYGGSGGGVLTSWIVGHTDRFAAASVNYPVTNWFSFVGTTDGIGWYQNFEKKPWEDPTEHIKRSPLMYVGNVKTPTMLMCGVKDLRTPISQTEEYYQALKVNQVPTMMIRFNEEFHGTSSKPSNFLRTFGYLSAWFDKYSTKGQAKP